MILNKIVKMFAVLAILTLLTMPVLAGSSPSYQIKKVGTNHIRLVYDYSQAKYMDSYAEATPVAKAVVKKADGWNMDRNRSWQSIRNEIQYKAGQDAKFAKYPFYMKGKVSTEIHVDEGEWDWLFLM